MKLVVQMKKYYKNKLNENKTKTSVRSVPLLQQQTETMQYNTKREQENEEAHKLDRSFNLYVM
jgi:hypothetical protein